MSLIRSIVFFVGYALIQLPGMIGFLHSWIQNRSKINYKYPKEGAREKSFAINNQVNTSRTLRIGKRKCKILTDFRSRAVCNESSDNLKNIIHKLEALQSEINHLKMQNYERTESKTNIDIQ